MNHEIIPDPPFADSLQSHRADAWKLVKRQLLVGTILTGKIYYRAPYGVFFDAGVGFPVLIEVPEFGKPEGGMIFPEDYPAIGSLISGEIVGFRDETRQIVVVKTGNLLFYQQLSRNMGADEAA